MKKLKVKKKMKNFLSEHWKLRKLNSRSCKIEVKVRLMKLEGTRTQLKKQEASDNEEKAKYTDK